MLKNSEHWLTRLTGWSVVLTAFVLPLSVTALSVLYPLTALLSLFNYRQWNLKTGWWKHPVVLVFAIYFLFYLLSLSYSIGTWQEGLKDLKKHFWLLGTIFLIPIFTEKKWRDYTLNAFLAAMIITLFLSYAKFLHLFTWRPDLGVSALFNNYIVQSLLLAFGTALLFDRYFSSEKKSWILLLVGLLMLANVFLISESRSGYVILSVLILYLGFLRFRMKGLIPAGLLLVLVLVGAYLFSHTLHSRVNQVLYETQQLSAHYETSMGRRYAEADNAWYLVKKAPIIGYGAGGLKTAYHSLPAERYQRADINDQLDLDYFNILLKFGFIGLIFVFIFFAVLWHYAKFLDPREHYIAGALVLFFLIGCIADDLMSTIVCSYLLSLFAALCFAKLFQKSIKV